MNKHTKQKKWNLRSQITVFIIIGIIILFSTALVVYIRGEAVKHKPALREVVEEIPTELYPIREYIKECVIKVGEEAIEKIGKGGYINPENTELSQTFFNINPNVVESDALIFAPGSNFIIPYWWYMASKNDCKDNCRFASKMPFLYKSQGKPSIQYQIEKYIQDNIDSCIMNLSVFVTQGFKTELVKAPKLQIEITDMGVDMLLDYPMKIQKGEVMHTISKFYGFTPIRLKRIYEAATEILNVQIRDQFLEHHTLNLIGIYGGMNKNRLPPIGGYSMDCSDISLMWTRSDVTDNMIVPMLMSYIPLLQFQGSANYQPYNFNDPIRESIYDYAMLILTDSPRMNNLITRVNYIGWDPYVKINPSKGGEILSPFGMCLRMFNIGFVEAKFSYDVSYPVLIEITDPEAFEGRGYTFYFALESNIRNNWPMNTTDIYQFAPPDNPPVTPDPLWCNMNQRMSGDINITIKDAYSENMIDDVLVNFCIPDADGTCSDESCVLGNTQLHNKETLFSGKMPIGVGLLIFYKQGYHTLAMVYSTAFNISDTFEIEMYPYKEIEVDVRKRVFTTKQDKKEDICGEEIDYYPWVYPTPSTEITEAMGEIGYVGFGTDFTLSDLEDDETAIVVLERTTPSYEPFITVIEFKKGTTEKLELIPGNYTMTVTILKNKPLNIDGENLCYCTGIFGCGIEGTFTDTRTKEPIDPINIEEPILLGGAKINFTVSKYDLKYNNKLIIYTISPDYKGFKTHESIGMLGLVDDLSSAYIEKIKPRFD